jgi:hypothetical protein
MGRIEKQWFFGAAAAGLSGLFALNSAVAAPPTRPMQMARPLDLSAPAHFIEASNISVGGSPVQGRFANLTPGPLPTKPSIQERVRLSRRDGFPVARLWENNSTLLHLGLNPKGKPGLWLMKKTR